MKMTSKYSIRGKEDYNLIKSKLYLNSSYIIEQDIFSKSVNVRAHGLL